MFCLVYMFMSESRGNTCEFERLFKENYSQLYRCAYYYLNDRGASEDVVSDAFEYVWKSYEQSKSVDWVAVLFQQVRHRSINQLRHLKIVEKYVLEIMETDSEIENFSKHEDERLERVQKVINTLSPQTRKVLEGCYFQGKKYIEVGDELGISVNTVKKHIMKVLSLLREEFA